MKLIKLMSLMALLGPVQAEEIITMTDSINIDGRFDVELSARQDDDAPAGRMIIRKQYSGPLKGIGLGQMLSKRTDGGSAVYVAIEEFEGELAGDKGTFTLMHTGTMGATGQTLDVRIVPGSGTGDLQGITGSMDIKNEPDGHRYLLTYTK